MMNKLSLQRILFSSLCVLILATGVCSAIPQTAHAQNVAVQTEAFRTGSGFKKDNEDPRKLIALLVNGILSILGMVMVGYLIWGGYLIITGGGVEDRIARGRRSIWTSIVGGAVLLSAFAIANMVVKQGGNAANGNQNTVNGTFNAPFFGAVDGSADIGVSEDSSGLTDPLADQMSDGTEVWDTLLGN